MNNYERIKSMTVDVMASRLAIAYLAGARVAINSISESLEDTRKIISEENFNLIIEEYKQCLLSEVEDGNCRTN